MCRSIAFFFGVETVLSLSLLIAPSLLGPEVWNYFITCNGNKTVSQVVFLVLICLQLNLVVLNTNSWFSKNVAVRTSCENVVPCNSTSLTFCTSVHGSRNEALCSTRRFGKHDKHFQADANYGILKVDLGAPVETVAWSPVSRTYKDLELSCNKEFNKGRTLSQENEFFSSIITVNNAQLTCTLPNSMKSSNIDSRVSSKSLSSGNLRTSGLSNMEIETNISSRGLVPNQLPRVCWNSLWMTIFFFVFYFGFHAAVMGWNAFGAYVYGAHTVHTCMHMKVQREKGNVDMISEFVFTELFGCGATSMLFVRKFWDPYKTVNYFKFWKSPKSYWMHAILQVILVGWSAADIIRCFFLGFGTPMQIFGAFLLSSLILWILCVLCHVLQIDKISPRNTTLEYNWFWSLFCLFIIWLCGFLFYFSVYKIETSYFYIAAHFSLWLSLILLTGVKFRRIFEFR